MNPYMTLEGISGITFFLMCVIFVMYHSTKTSKFTILHFSIVGAAILYGIGMPIVVYGMQELDSSSSHFFSRSVGFTILQTAFSAVAVLGIYLGWRSPSRKKRYRLSRYFLNVRPKSLVPWLFVMLIVSVVAMYLYTKDYGGFAGYFAYSRLVRAGHFDLFDRSTFSFLRPFGGFAYLSAFGFWGLILSRRHSVLNYLGLAMALAMSTYVLMAFSGRLSMILFLSVFPVSIGLLRRTSPIVWSIVLPASAPVMIGGIFMISNVLELKASHDINEFIIREISFPFTAFYAQINDGNNFHLFYHLILSPLYLLPSSIVGPWLTTASQINTATIHGAAKGVGGVTSGMPVDLITFGLMQFHVVGVFLYAMFFGWFLRLITSIAGSFSLPGVSAAFTAYVALRVGIFGVFYADPKHLIEGNFPFILSLLAVMAWRTVQKQSTSS